MPVAVVGFGRFGRLHALRLRAHPQFQLLYVVDDCAEARAQAKDLGFQALSDVAELPPSLNAATVTTPPDTHADVASTLMRRGLHVLVEKPLASSEAGILHLLETARETGRILCTGHIERFNSKKIQLTDGKVIEFHRVTRSKPPGVHAALDLLVHDLDLIAYWLDLPPEDVIGIKSARLNQDEIDVRAVLAGIPLRLRAAYGAPSSRAAVRCGSASPVAQRLAEAPSAADLHALYGHDALTRQYSAFHKRLHGHASPIADGVAGSAAARRALAILRAI